MKLIVLFPIEYKKIYSLLSFVQISKNNKIISLENLEVGDEIDLQTPKYIASCTLNKIKKQQIFKFIEGRIMKTSLKLVLN